MKKTKEIQEALIGAVLSLVDADLDRIAKKQCSKLAGELRESQNYAFNVLLPSRRYSGGVMTKRGSTLAKGQERDFLMRIKNVLQVYINAWAAGRLEDEDLGDVKLNFSMIRSDRWFLTVTTSGPPEGEDPDLWHIRLALFWALDGRPADCIKRCVWCKRLFLQRTARRKEYCSHAHAMRGADARRKNDPARKEQLRQAVRRYRQKGRAGKKA